MASIFEQVQVFNYNDDQLSFFPRYNVPLTLEVIDESDKLLIRDRPSSSLSSITSGGENGITSSAPTNSVGFTIEIYKDTPCAEFGGVSNRNTNHTTGGGGGTGAGGGGGGGTTPRGFVITDENGQTVLLRFGRHYTYDQTKANYTEMDITRFAKLVNDFKHGGKESIFTLRTDSASAAQYFQFYGYLSQQQNMMQDYIRTSTYQRAILSNVEDFRDKVVLDVGAGSGILSFFAVQAGARKVYAVEASSMAKHAEHLVMANKLNDRILVIPGKIEEIQLPEKVDIIISEPMGYMLFNERMLETYLHAKKWLAPNGNMFPTRGDLHVAPFSDGQLFTEQLTKANFWFQQNFHGVDLTALRNAALKEYFYQPVVDTFDIRICIAKSNKYTVDFLKAHENDLHTIDIPLKFEITQTDEIHGLAFWFDVAFFGSQQAVWLSTSPTQPLTHWYQVRCLLDKPLFVQRGWTVSGRVQLVSNRRQSYNVNIELGVDGVPNMFASNTLDLKNPYFRYNGAPIQPPPGCNQTSPSEDYWSQLDQAAAAAAAQVAVVNGGSGVGGGGVQTVPAVGGIAAPTVMIGNGGGGGGLLNGGTHSMATLTNGTMDLSVGGGGGAAAAMNLSAQQHHQSQQHSTGLMQQQQQNHPLLHHQTQQQHQAHQQQQQIGLSNINAALPQPPQAVVDVPTVAAASAVVPPPQQPQPQLNTATALNLSAINTLNFPVNSDLMIGDYAAATGAAAAVGSTSTIGLPPYKPTN